MATQNSNNNDVNVSSLFPINITTADDITLSSSNLIDIAGTNGTTVQDSTSITIDSPQNGFTGVSTFNGPLVAQTQVSLNGNGAGVSLTETTGNIALTNDVGLIELINTGAAIHIFGEGGVGQDVFIRANGSTSASLEISTVGGTASDSVRIESDEGGITIQSSTSLSISNGSQSFEMLTGNTDPNGSVNASQGSLFVDVAGTGNDTLYVNTDGSTSWSALSTGGGSGSNLTWAVDSGAGPINLLSGTGHLANNAGTITYNLPASASVGQIFGIGAMNNDNSWIIAQGAGQYIQLGNATTTVGASGSISSTAVGNTIVFICSVADTGFYTIQGIGNMNVV